MAKTAKERMREAMAKLKSIAAQLKAWYKRNGEKEVQAFIKANLPLAIEVVKKVAKDFASTGSRLKFGKAIEIIGDELELASPGIKLNNDWLGSLIQFAFDLLRATGQLK